jgi:hypothetical protein
METRSDLPTLCKTGSTRLIGVELGVARGKNAHNLVRKTPDLVLCCIDRWSGDRGHSLDELVAASNLLAPYKDRALIMRGSFEHYLPLFPDEYFDFVYIDGYAHTGQLGGSTLRDWWPKAKTGGVFAGHDYHPEYQPTIDAVDAFFAELGIPFSILNEEPYPSWYVVKP